MNNYKIKKVIITASIVLISFLLFLIIHTILQKNSDNDFYESLSEIDRDIDYGYIKSAGDKIPAQYEKIKNPENALSLLKRISKIDDAAGDYSSLESYSEKLERRYPRNIEIAAVSSYASLMNGNVGAACAKSEKKLAKSVYNSIYLAAVLKSSDCIIDSGVSKKIADKFRIFFSGEEADADSFLSAADKIMDERLKVNAAVSLMAEGRRDEALKLVADEPRSFGKAGMYIAYDCGDLMTAENCYRIYSEDHKIDADMKLFAADIYLEKGDREKACSLYGEVIGEKEDYSWIPYRNLYSIEDDPLKAAGFLDAGLEMFPGNDELSASRAWENDLAETEAGGGILTGLYRTEGSAGSRSPENITGNYWKMYNGRPDSKTAAISFSNYLLKQRSFGQLGMLLDRYEKINGKEAWSIMYRGIVMSAGGDFGQAAVLFDESIEQERSAAALYNGAVNYTKLKSPEKAMSLLNEAEKAAIDEDNEIYLEKIYYNEAENYYNTYRYDDAVTNLHKVLKINPNSLRASLLLGKIQEGYDD